MHFSFSVNVAGQFHGTLEVTDSDYVLNSHWVSSKECSRERRELQ